MDLEITWPDVFSLAIGTNIRNGESDITKDIVWSIKGECESYREDNSWWYLMIWSSQPGHFRQERREIDPEAVMRNKDSYPIFRPTSTKGRKNIHFWAVEQVVSSEEKQDSFRKKWFLTVTTDAHAITQLNWATSGGRRQTLLCFFQSFIWFESSPKF